MSYLVLKTIHLIAVVCWFAGLFYMGRLFIYHKEAEKKEKTEKNILQNQYKIMANRLMYIITWPSTIITSFFGFYMLYENSSLISLNWMKVKLVFVFILISYTFITQALLNQLNKYKIKFNDFTLRIWNEIATLLLISIISLAVLKSSISWLNSILIFIAIGITLMLLIRLYKFLLKRN
jgi:putative membrane protein